MESYKSVLSNMYKLVFQGLLVAAGTAFISAELSLLDSWLSLLITFAVAMGLVVTASAKAETGAGVWWALAFFGTMGLLLGPSVAVVDSSTIFLSLVVTAITFAVLSVYVTSTKKDFTYMGGFLFVALIGLLLVCVVNIFVQSSVLNMVISYVTVLLFSAFILYDTSTVVTGKETNYIRAALSMFLNIMNLFSGLLTIFED